MIFTKKELQTELYNIKCKALKALLKFLVSMLVRAEVKNSRYYVNNNIFYWP